MFLSVNEIDSYYGQSKVLHRVSLEVDRGEAVALLGRNGVGKSTLLMSIMGAVPAASGQIEFDGRPIRGLKPHQVARLGLGLVPEERRIFAGLTVRENLIMGLQPGARRDETWTVDRIYERFPQLEQRDRVAGGSLSGGEQQLLSIARALMGNPSLLLVDEPSEGLSPILAQEIFDLLSQLNEQGVSLLVVDQNLDFSCRLTRRAYIMQKGQVVHCASAKEVLDDEEIQAKFLAV
jgi:branched-chain amino acid transport system ATP-binding protein